MTAQAQTIRLMPQHDQPSSRTGATLSATLVPLGPDCADQAAIRQAVADLTNGPGLRAAAQLSRFLRFIVEESLAGRGDKLKAYTIATCALGRPSDFDPSRDPIVRVEATRLRAALANYYAAQGEAAPVRLHLVPGSYRPVIEIQAGTAPSKAAASRPTAPPPPARKPQLRTQANSGVLTWIVGASLVMNLFAAATIGFGLHALAQFRDAHPTMHALMERLAAQEQSEPLAKP